MPSPSSSDANSSGARRSKVETSQCSMSLPLETRSLNCVMTPSSDGRDKIWPRILPLISVVELNFILLRAFSGACDFNRQLDGDNYDRLFAIGFDDKQVAAREPVVKLRKAARPHLDFDNTVDA